MSLRTKNRERTENAILEASKALLENQDFESVTTRQIASAAEISYQTLYNYFPSKTDILAALFKGQFSAPEKTYQDIIRTFSGDLVGSINQLNKSQFDSVQQPQNIDKEFSLFQSIILGAKKSDLLSITKLFDRVGSERYQALLTLGRGMGRLKDDTDIQLMSHTLYIIVGYAFERFILSESKEMIFLESLNEQTEQLVKPYLIDGAD